MEEIRRLAQTQAPARGEIQRAVTLHLEDIRAARLRGWGWGRIAEALGFSARSRNAVLLATHRADKAVADRPKSPRKPEEMSPRDALGSKQHPGKSKDEIVW